MDYLIVGVWIAAVVFAIVFLGYLLYQLFYKSKNLIESTLELKLSIQETKVATTDLDQFEPATANTSEDIFVLLGQRRKRKKLIERKKRARQRRLISRISDIETSERFK